MTEVDARKTVDQGAQECMTVAVSACVEATADGVVPDCKPHTTSIKQAVKDCTGLH